MSSYRGEPLARVLPLDRRGSAGHLESVTWVVRLLVKVLTFAGV
jgi:hypothetical protein